MHRRRFDFSWNINTYKAGRKYHQKNIKKNCKKVLTKVEDDGNIRTYHARGHKKLK